MGQKLSNLRNHSPSEPIVSNESDRGARKSSTNSLVINKLHKEVISDAAINTDSTENLSVSSDLSSTPNFKWLEGRPFMDVKGSQAIYPVDGEEADRLNLVFHRSKTAASTIYFAPIKSMLSKPGAKALDIGCGTGIWMKEMGETFPNANFTGLDITGEYISKTVLPSNCTFCQHNAIEGLPFADDTFDYVHQSDMAVTWTKDQWRSIVSEIMRVLKPGGYIELWEIDCQPHRQGPASRLINDPIIFALQARGLDPIIARRIQAVLASQNFRKIQTNFFSLPFAWGGPIGEVTEAIILAAVRNIKPWLSSAINADSETFDKMVEASVADMQEYKTYVNQHIAWGMKGRQKQPSSVETKSNGDGHLDSDKTKTR